MAENNAEFLAEQKRAVERMMELQSRAVGRGTEHKMPPSPPFLKMPSGAAQNSHSNRSNAIETAAPVNKQKYEGNTTNGDLGLGAILDRLKIEKDTPLVLGLLLLLWSENADKKLLLALLYILM